ncbi:hypothetical protein [Escherichia albertii]|uniref:Uncharacterized protein n=1 Tax=Escherichia albertii TaxID=208962 RepID=A0A7Z7YJ67_ESCAL|nr:hypothetical protein [Escherichia albertii]CTW16056.1 Uncharacterised protein [Escherichia coli]EFF0798570.1 hypothetical protein [Escherichia albertii]EHG7532574.1 hypothetical protein [Escherichia albertii]MCQ8929075.1 hypothetical protein [Escherichia albertii]MCQ8967604.1 hypothetical protein [Escherichia albertii]
MCIEFLQVHEIVYIHDIANTGAKKKPKIPLQKFLSAETASTQTRSWGAISGFVSVNTDNKQGEPKWIKHQHIADIKKNNFLFTESEIDYLNTLLRLSFIEVLQNLSVNINIMIFHTAAFLKNKNTRSVHEEFDFFMLNKCC